MHCTLQVSVDIEDVTKEIIENDEYDPKDTYVLGFSPSKLKDPKKVRVISMFDMLKCELNIKY